MVISDLSKAASEKFELVKQLYEYEDHRHAVAILVHEYPQHFIELCDVLLSFRLLEDDVKKEGGNESNIPKAFSALLRPRGWMERKLKAKLVVEDEDKTDEVSTDTHHIDYVKSKVAFDLEWNSKDQTFDRDLYAFRAFFEFHRIAVAVLVTRGVDLESYFACLGSYVDRNGASRKYKEKYGASTTHMNKLLPRLNAGRSGGCPVLALGITQKILEKSNG